MDFKIKLKNEQKKYMSQIKSCVACGSQKLIFTHIGEIKFCTDLDGNIFIGKNEKDAKKVKKASELIPYGMGVINQEQMKIVEIYQVCQNCGRTILAKGR